MHAEVLQDKVDPEFEQWHLELMQVASTVQNHPIQQQQIERQQGPSLSAKGEPSTSSTTVCISGQHVAIAQTSAMGERPEPDPQTRPKSRHDKWGWLRHRSTKGAFQTSSIPDNDGFVRAPRNPPPPLVHPPSIRRELLRRLSQKRDHFFDIGKLLARSNPALAHAFYSTEVSSQPSCASQYIRGTAEWLYRLRTVYSVLFLFCSCSVLENRTGTGTGSKLLEQQNTVQQQQIERQQGPSLSAKGGPSTSSTTVCISGQHVAIAQRSPSSRSKEIGKSLITLDKLNPIQLISLDKLNPIQLIRILLSQRLNTLDKLNPIQLIRILLSQRLITLDMSKMATKLQ
uniref:Uncharacterized protein n=1 Tax=Globodera rostochiensis TaxID=31243 RepID=A0A914HN53_GLORO